MTAPTRIIKLTLLLCLLLLISRAPVNQASTAAPPPPPTAAANSVHQQQPYGELVRPASSLDPELKRKFIKLGQGGHHHQAQNVNNNNNRFASSTTQHLKFSDLINKLGTRMPPSDTTAAAAALQQQEQQSNYLQQLMNKKNLFEKICIGTSNKLLLTTRNKTEHYLKLVERYRDCTYVIGNLEITWLSASESSQPLDMSFLESIREITGYLLIARVNVEKISMPNLQIIRGRDLIAVKRNCETMKCDDQKEKDELAILLLYNEIKSLELPNLREILAGGVGSLDNKNLCYLRTINWEEILNPPYKAIFRYDMFGQPECPTCDKSCLGNCWADGPNMCQKFSKTICAPSCQLGRCFGSAPHECCHPFCAGGCTGPKRTDCLACKNFYNDGECIQECPPMQKYNSNNFSWELNPKGKYAYGASCVKECPDYLLRDNGACVRTCPTNKRNSNGECLSCSGPGPKECPQGDVISPHQGNMMLDAADNVRFVNCSLLESSILDPTFTGFADLLGDGKLAACNQQLPELSSPPALQSSLPEQPQAAPQHQHQQESQDAAPPASNTSSTTQSETTTKQDPWANCKAIINSTAQLQLQLQPSADIQCLKPDEVCPDGYFQELLSGNSAGGRLVCRRCHHRCRRCTGMGTHVSACECTSFVVGEQCEDYCPRDYYTDEKSRHCGRCSPECNGCSGPTEADCHTCRVYRLYSSTSTTSSATDSFVESNNIADQQQQQDTAAAAAAAVNQRRPFNCTSQCPPERPYRVSDGNQPDLYCSELPDINGDGALSLRNQSNQANYGLGTWLMLMCAFFVGGALCLKYYRQESEKDKTVKLTMHLNGIDDVEPLNPSNMKPNLAPLRSIKETELRKGNELGSGFGGTVYQGLWYPEGREHKNPRPVAIKVLRDNGQSNMNKKFLDEAYIMASVNHPNLVQLLAVCMTPKHLMLVTPLMPLGCLLEHVKKHKHDISAKNLLEWSKQIARGMAYLEENRMVHRDLALRNVLLRTCGRAMISDFGLAKFLELDQSEYHSLGGRLPVKWLAPECITERRFTHKSDVWAFGVTVWELLNFGKKPFEEYSTWKDMLMAVVNGARLAQPPYLSAEVYKLMMCCWFYNPEARPSFRQLTQDFVKFARDPLRYVAIGARGIVYDCAAGSPAIDSPRSGKFSRFTSGKDKQSMRQSAAAAADLYNDLDEYGSAVDWDQDQSQVSSPLADDIVQHQHHHHHQLLAATSELTPSTHNRINETIRFDFTNQTAVRRHHRHASLSESSDTLKTPTTPLKRQHFTTADQRLIEEVGADYDDIDVFKSSAPSNKTKQQQQQLDGNNNIITVSPDANDSWTRQQQRQHKSGSTATEPPTDMDDYLLPSPCNGGATHNFSQLYGNNGFDEVDALLAKQHQQLPDLVADATTTASAAPKGNKRPPGPAQDRCSTLPVHHHSHLSASMIGVNNYEYFITRASSQYHLAGQQHYAEMDQSMVASGRTQQQQSSEQHSHLSTSNEDIPHSLV